MASASVNTNRDHWQAKAAGVARTVNFAWWLEAFSVPLLAGSMVVTAALLILRREFPETLSPAVLAVSIGGAVVFLGLGCWLRAARRFEKPADSLVRIEAAMRMRNSLSAASAGVAPWPEPVAKVNAGLSWNWPRLIIPPLGALLLLGAGLYFPIPRDSSGPASSPEQPQAWKQLSADLERLTKEEIVDEEYLEDTRKKLDELKAQEEEDWFSHSSLEATDSLKKSHRAESQRVGQELDRADKALGNLEKNAGKMDEAEKNRVMEDFDQALKGLQNGAMKPNPKLLEQMKQMDMKDMGNLNPEQMQQLRENLKKAAEGMKEGQGQGEDWSDELLDGQDGQGDGQNPGGGEGQGQEGEEGGDGPGQGGVNRGPGHDPRVLGKEKDALATGKLEGLEAKDLSNSTPGDLLELQEGEHDVDKSASKTSDGGNTDATGKGGDRVWKEALDPGEQRTLKRFFE